MKFVNDLKSRAILIDFDGGYYNWTKRDKHAEKEVASAHDVSRSAGRYLKNVFLGCDAPLATIRTIVADARNDHNLMTLDWEEGRRLLLNTNYLTYTKRFQEHLMHLQDAKQVLADSYDSLLQQARYHLKDMWREEDYPRKEEILAACYITRRAFPIADASDVRLDLSEDIVAEIQAEVTANQASQFESAVSSTWERLYKLVEAATQNLAKNLNGGSTGARFHTEWHEALAQLLPLIDGLNLTQDPRLTEMSQRCWALLADSTDDLKLSKPTRAAAYTKAQAIFDDLAAIYSPQGGLK